MNAVNKPAAGDVTRMLQAVREGIPHAGDELMEAVYGELRQIARSKMQSEPPGHTLQATALVHEAWLRLGDGNFNDRPHFFAAAAEAMRRILVERARRKGRVKHGAGAEHCDIGDVEIVAPVADAGELLAVNEALDQLARHDARKAELVKLRYFAGLTFEEAAEALGISVPTAKRDWAYARAWLFHAVGDGAA
jgi:RNA polymerase sigma factor (TIGR02999 family)